MLTVPPSSSKNRAILVPIAREGGLKKGVKHIFILRRFKYNVIVYQCSLGELRHEG